MEIINKAIKHCGAQAIPLFDPCCFLHQLNLPPQYLLYKLQKDIVGKQLFEVIKDMYNSCESSVKIENEHRVFLK
jgi:hypothetical protein